jgi:hypothetical protein
LGLQRLPLIQPPLVGFDFLLYDLGFGDVGPETGFRSGAFEKGYFFFFMSEVKDTPIGVLPGPLNY